jgi:hypothetical protein
MRPSYALPVRAILVIAIVLAARDARADTPARAAAATPTLVALAPADDARNVIAIGPAGQIYEPDGSGAWVRRQAGGVAAEVVAAATVGTTVIAGAKGAPPFKLKGGAWTAMNLGLRAKAILGTGSRALAAVGKSVFALDRAQPQKLAEAPGSITALAASKTGVVIATDKGLMKLAGSVFKPVKQGPKSVRALVSDRWALVERGLFDLKTMKAIAWPTGIHIALATTLGNDFIGVSQHDNTVELVTIKAGKVVREAVPIDNPGPVVGIVADTHARVALALRDGRIALRDQGAWTVSEVREELATAKPGPAPAESQ